MSDALHLLYVPVRLSALARYAGHRGWTARRDRDGREIDAGFDSGRALHHILDETFGPSALKPFRIVAPRNRDRATVYAYTRLSKDALLTRVAETGVPELANGWILDLRELETKPMPTDWSTGKRLGFDVRVRPVVRIRKPLPNPRPSVKAYKEGSEVDAFVAEAQKGHPEGWPQFVDGAPTASAMVEAGRDRAAVYRDWLAARFGGSVDLDHERTEMVAFMRTRVSRSSASVEGPDATFHGEFTIADPAAFNTLLGRGVGRHLSFGYGMLLLRPARRR